MDLPLNVPGSTMDCTLLQGTQVPLILGRINLVFQGLFKVYLLYPYNQLGHSWLYLSKLVLMIVCLNAETKFCDWLYIYFGKTQ